jgi:uncharacterized protein YigE (DUF2233 family)
MVRAQWMIIAIILALLLTCGLSALVATPTPTPTSTPTVTPTWTPAPTPTRPPADTGWRPITQGVAVRNIRVSLSTGVELVTIARIDPARAVLDLRVAPGGGRRVSAWAAAENALVTVNAGYFTEEQQITGLTIAAGERFGTPYGDFAGMLAVPPAGPPEVRWLREHPYDPTEPLRAGVQSFPVLVKPGGVMGFPADADAGQVARRTVVAQDRQGRLLFLTASNGYFSLHELAKWLVDSDLEVDAALNLDGGKSSGLWVRGEVSAQQDSYVEIPAVIVVWER